MNPNYFLLKVFVSLFKRFNRIAVPIGLLLSILIYPDLRQYMIPIAVLYYGLVGIMLYDIKKRSKLLWDNPIRLFFMDLIYITLMVFVCYGWISMLLYMKGIKA